MKGQPWILGVAHVALGLGCATGMSGCIDFWVGKPKPVITADPPVEQKPDPAPPPPASQPVPPKPQPNPEPALIPTARPVPGKEGLVFSPFNNKMIDVKDFPRGSLVADPRYSPSERKYFRVP